MQKLDPNQVKEALASVPEWKLSGQTISRVFEFKDFAGALQFVNAVGRVAEEANHHPDIDVRWNKVTLALSTHSAGGLTASDFDLARKVDRL